MHVPYNCLSAITVHSVIKHADSPDILLHVLTLIMDTILFSDAKQERSYQENVHFQVKHNVCVRQRPRHRVLKIIRKKLVSPA